jgi:hypothetical protein
MTKEDYQMLKSEVKQDIGRSVAKGALVFLGLWAALSAFVLYLMFA